MTTSAPAASEEILETNEGMAQSLVEEKSETTSAPPLSEVILEMNEGFTESLVEYKLEQESDSGSKLQEQNNMKVVAMHEEIANSAYEISEKSLRNVEK